MRPEPCSQRGKKVRVRVPMVRVLTLPELLLCQPWWHHTSYRGIDQFHRMQRWDTLAQALQRSVNLQEAARISRCDDIGMHTQDMLSFALAQLVGRLRLDQVVDAGATAADVCLRNVHHLDPRNATQHLTWLQTDALRMGKMAGVMVGYAQLDGMARRHRLQLGQDLRDVPYRVRECSGAFGVLGVVAQQVSILLHSGATTGGIDHHCIYSPDLKRIDQTPCIIQALFFASRVNAECATASLSRRHDNITPFGCQDAHSGSIDGIKEHALHTAQQQPHSSSPRPLRSRECSRSRAQRPQAHRRHDRFHTQQSSRYESAYRLRAQQTPGPNLLVEPE